jgi:hypothetical protein
MNNLDNKTNKLKHLFGLVISMFFVIIGIFLVTKSETIDSSYPINKIVGMANIVFFGCIGLISFKKILSNISY